MGNSELSCLTQRGLNKGELSSINKEDTAVADEYKKKVTRDDILKILTAEKSRPPQQSRTYDKGTVKVSVF
jgi:hypothetical protein